MDDFLYNIRNGNYKHLDRKRRRHNDFQNNGKEGPESCSKHDTGISSSAEQVRLNAFLEEYTDHWERFADANERDVAAEERKADAMQRIAFVLAKLAGNEESLDKINVQVSPRPKEEKKSEESAEETVREDEGAQIKKGKEKKSNNFPNRFRSKIMDTITRLRDSDMSFSQIARQLEKEKIPTLSGRGKWHASTVANILK